MASQSIFPISCIGTEGDFTVVDSQEVRQRVDDLLIKYVTDDPTAPDVEIAKELGLDKTGRTIRRMLNRLGWHRVKGGPEGASPWHNDKGEPCPYLEDLQAEKDTKDAAKKVAADARASKAAARAERKRLNFKPSELTKQVSINDMLPPVKGDGDVELVDPY